MTLMKFPSSLRAARLSKGWAQKVAAHELHLDQGQYCGVERGRRPPLPEPLIRSLCAALGLNQAELDDLIWAAQHDRCVRFVQASEPSADSAGLVSELLSACRFLSASQRDGLAQHLKRLSDGTGAVRALELGLDRNDPAKERA